MRLDFSPEELDTLADTLAVKVAEKLKSLLRQGQEEDTVFTPETLSAYLHISRDKIYNMTHLKEIPHFKVGRELRFRRVDIDRWLQDSYTPAISGISGHFKGRVAICQK